MPNNQQKTFPQREAHIRAFMKAYPKAKNQQIYAEAMKRFGIGISPNKLALYRRELGKAAPGTGTPKKKRKIVPAAAAGAMKAPVRLASGDPSKLQVILPGWSIANVAIENEAVVIRYLPPGA